VLSGPYCLARKPTFHFDKRCIECTGRSLRRCHRESRHRRARPQHLHCCVLKRGTEISRANLASDFNLIANLKGGAFGCGIYAPPVESCTKRTGE